MVHFAVGLMVIPGRDTEQEGVWDKGMKESNSSAKALVSRSVIHPGTDLANEVHNTPTIHKRSNSTERDKRALGLPDRQPAVVSGIRVRVAR